MSLALALLVLALGGCGGSDEGATTAGSTQGTAAAQGAPQTEPARAGEKHGGASGQLGGGKGEGSKSAPGQGNDEVAAPPISSAPVEGSKAVAPGVKTVKGGDNSVQAYGVEASEAARTEAGIVLQAYLAARAQADWGVACSYLARKPRQQFEELAKSVGERDREPQGCAGAMGALSERVSRAVLRESATIDEVLSFRIDGDLPGSPSFLIFLGRPGSTLYSMPMYREGGGWKVGLVVPSQLPV